MLEVIKIIGVVVGGAGTAGGVCLGIFKFGKKLFDVLKDINKKLDDVKDLKTDVSELREAQRYLFKSSYASLDGLIQLHANGPVTKARNDLNDYMIERKWHE